MIVLLALFLISYGFLYVQTYNISRDEFSWDSYWGGVIFCVALICGINVVDCGIQSVARGAIVCEDYRVDHRKDIEFPKGLEKEYVLKSVYKGTSSYETRYIYYIKDVHNYVQETRSAQYTNVVASDDPKNYLTWQTIYYKNNKWWSIFNHAEHQNTQTTIHINKKLLGL